MGDLISRDAVIEILAAMQGRCNTKAALVQNSKIWQQIKDLPSAQPEIIRCEDCKYYYPAYCEVWSRYGTVQTMEAGYCYMAERRE